MMSKEEIKEKRKKLYQELKAKRDNDPEYVAMKQKAKKERQKKYQEYKEQIKAQKNAEKEQRQKQKDQVLADMFDLTPKLKLIKSNIFE